MQTWKWTPDDVSSEVAAKRFDTESPAYWGEGPWTDEPDKAVWVDEGTDFDCMIHRGVMGQLCGYVAVPAGHPFFGERDWERVNAEVAPSINFTAECQEGGSPEFGICHVPAEGRPKDVWWIGFDCGHAPHDLVPQMEATMRWMYAERGEPEREPMGTYRTFDYVKALVSVLALQLAEVAE